MSTQKSLSPWSYKPWWCQPWSILLTGTMIIAVSWALVKTVWVTVLISLPILVWWTYFLVLWPQLIMGISSTEGKERSSQDSTPQLEINREHH